MNINAKRREQLEHYINLFKKIAEKRDLENEKKWIFIIPAMVSVILVVCQTINALFLISYAYNIRQLSIELDLYFNNILNSNITWPKENNNSISLTSERLLEIDKYQESLWQIFVSEIIKIVLPFICLITFAYEVALNKNGKKINFKILAIYILCPILTLILSLAQACMLLVTLSKQISPIRYIINRVSTTLLSIYPQGRSNLERFFKCEFYDTVDELPPCSGVFHDQVLSTVGINFMLALHIFPFICAIYLLIQHLKSKNVEHLFLHIETIQSQKDTNIKNNNEIANYLSKTLNSFETKFG
uniref:MARVEL domain-containing protein n=1 Tax=Strongyloides stercoralis TaxID=6248 RepID=A0A0K0EM64_STRER